MCRFTIILLSFLVNREAVFSARVDQRQTGDFNVQIDLKNLQIVSLTKGKEEYVDYDYAYDYSEMTIKPPSGTNKPLNVTESPLSDKDNTTAATVLAELDQSTISIENNSSLSTENLTTTQMVDASNSFGILNSTTTPLQDSTESSTTSADCKKGFFRNSKGSCELKLQNPSNALVKMIKQKLKISGNKGGTQL